MDIFRGDTVCKRRVGGGDGFFGSGCNAERVGFVGRGLDPILQPMLQEELKEHAV